MSDHILPHGWASAQLPDLIGVDGVFVDGDWIESKDQDPNGDVRLIQLADVGDGYYVDKSNRFLTREKAIKLGCTFLKKGDVLIARMPDPLGRACIFPGDNKLAVTVVDVCVVRSQAKHFSNRWLMHFVNVPAFREAINALQSGSTRKRISRGNLATLRLPIPPAAEQNRIVEKLEELLSDVDAGVAELKAAQKKLGQYRQSLLKAAVEGALTAEWRKNNKIQETGAQLLARILIERRQRWEKKQITKFKEQGKTPPKAWQEKYSEPVKPDTSNLLDLPEGWVWASVDQLGDVFLGKMLDKAKHQAGMKLPYLRNISVRWGNIETHDLPEMFFEDDELDRYGLAAGDVLVCEGGEPGRAAVCGKEHEHLKYQKALHRVRLFSLYEPELLMFFLEYIAKTGKLERSFTGSTIKHFTKESFITLPVPLPPINEQTEMVEQVKFAFQCAQDQGAAITYSLKQSAAQRKNILKSAFSGQLVPQDPHDEPASVLLERIRAERAVRAATNTKPGRRTVKQEAVHD